MEPKMGFNPLEELLMIQKRLTNALDSALVSTSRVKAREALWNPSYDILRTKDALWIHV